MYEVEETVQPLPFDVRYDIQTRAVCASDVASSRVDGNVTTGTITQSYNITLTQNGQTITEIPEGESATLTLTLDDASAVFDVNTDLVLGFLFTGNFSVTPNIPAIQIAEIQVSPPPQMVLKVNVPGRKRCLPEKDPFRIRSGRSRII